MKSKFFIIFFLVFQFVVAQKTAISGKILDKETGNPIYGVAILKGDNYLGFTDIDGSYNFNIDNEWINEIITFTHLSFQEIEISIAKLLEGHKISLMPKINSLEEVLIVGSVSEKSLKDLMKKAVNQFEEDYVDYPFWSSIDYKHLIHLDGNPHAFYQLKGHIQLVGRNEGNPFIDASIIPDQIRRTKESEKIVKSWFANSDSKNFSKTQLSYNEVENGWTDYRFVDVVHPLSKRGRKYFDYSYNYLSDVKNDYMVIDFVQKKPINIMNRWLDNMSGQIWLNKDDSSLDRIVTMYRFERIFYITYDISYKKIENKIFPATIKKTKYNFNSNTKEKAQVSISSISHLVDINTNEQSNYRKKYHGSFYSLSSKYDKDYWDDKKIKELKYINGLSTIIGHKIINDVFSEGANTKEYNSNISENDVKKWEAIGENVRKLMINDLKEE